MKKFFIIIFLMTMGCTSALVENINLVSSNYETVVFEDGITLEEAKIIAQQELINKNLVKIYDLSNPKIKKDISNLPHAKKYWFIFFKERQLSNIPYIFTAIIHKKTGRIKFADDYAQDNQWLLEAALLR